MDSGETKQGSQDRSQQQPPAPAQKCPRCESANTKFCYYNNYSLSQPRYFCKACRRYWTQGGTLRNVPVGGGCRKGKRLKTSSASPSVITTTTTSSAGHHPFLGSSNLSNPGPGLGSYYPGTAGFLLQSLNPYPPVPNQALMMGSSATTSSNLSLMQGFGGGAFAAGQFFGGGNPRGEEENLMLGFPSSSGQRRQMTSWQRAEEEYDVSAARNSVPETASWSVSTSTTVEADKGAGGGNVSLSRQLDDGRRWNHGGGGGGRVPGYGPS